MKAAVFYGPRDIRVKEVSKPVLEEGEILLRVRACGICGSDLHTYRHGMFEELGIPVENGSVLGHEFSGEIIEMNGTFPHLHIGDTVCTVGRGGNAEYAKVPPLATFVTTPIPEGVSFEEAATLEPLATSLHAVNLACPVKGETHVIIGAGIIGLGVLQVLKSKHDVKTIVVDLSDKRLNKARELGADTVINAKGEDAVERVREMTGTEILSFMPTPTGMAQVVYDCAVLTKGFAGSPPLQQALTMLQQNGKIILVSIFEKLPEFDFNLLVRKGITLFGSWAWTPEEFFAALELIRTGQVDRKKVISHQFPLGRAAEAYETQLREDDAVKVMIIP